MLDVVEDDEHAPVFQEVEDLGFDRFCARQFELERSRHGVGNALVRAQGGQGHEAYAVSKVGRLFAKQLEAEARFADTARSQQGEQVRLLLLEQMVQLEQFEGPTEKWRQGLR
jgi:hypothetical protein